MMDEGRWKMYDVRGHRFLQGSSFTEAVQKMNLNQRCQPHAIAVKDKMNIAVMNIRILVFFIPGFLQFHKYSVPLPKITVQRENEESRKRGSGSTTKMINP